MLDQCPPDSLVIVRGIDKDRCMSLLLAEFHIRSTIAGEVTPTSQPRGVVLERTDAEVSEKLGVQRRSGCEDSKQNQQWSAHSVIVSVFCRVSRGSLRDNLTLSVIASAFCDAIFLCES